MENGGHGGGDERLPLSEVVSECVRRWFQDALKEARQGDATMQVLVAQMYNTGYGVPKNEQKGNIALQYVSSELQVTDFFTKAQTGEQHRFLLSKLWEGMDGKSIKISGFSMEGWHKTSRI